MHSITPTIFSYIKIDQNELSQELIVLFSPFLSSKMYQGAIHFGVAPSESDSQRYNTSWKKFLPSFERLKELLCTIFVVYLFKLYPRRYIGFNENQ